jgi:hypothetical protein
MIIIVVVVPFFVKNSYSVLKYAVWDMLIPPPTPPHFRAVSMFVIFDVDLRGTPLIIWYSLYRRLGGPGAEKFASPGFDHRNVQLVGKRDTY